MRVCHCAASMHVGRLPVMASDLVNVASASRCRFSQLSLSYRAGRTGIEEKKDARGWAAEGEEKRMWEKAEEAEEDLYRAGNIWERSIKTRRWKHTREKESSASFWGLRRLTTVFLSRKHAIQSYNGDVVWVIYCLKCSFCNSVNLEHMEIFFIPHRNM